MSAAARYIFKYVFISFALVCYASASRAYSVLAHEAVIDASWKPTLLPLLKQKYPQASEKDLILAHSYAYGGSIVADMGYMPFGNGFFTDLVHYVRSGDFIENLINGARDLNEYAFALGALSHYMADKYGHSMSTNVNVPLIYPDLKKKFGEVVTYADDHTSHSRTEFAYDVLQIGQGNYTSEGYHDFIGFNMSVPVLQRAFYQTYGQQLSSIFSNISSAINTMRWGVRNLFPILTRSAYKTNQAEIEKMHPGMTVKKFSYKMSRRAFNLQYGKERKESKFFARAVVFVIKILPKIGPLKTLKFKSPGVEGQKLFAKSFDMIVDNYTTALKQAERGQLVLADINFDTGKPIKFGEYELVNKTYDKLVNKFQQEGYKNFTRQLQKDIIAFYNHPDTAKYAAKEPDKWQKTRIALTEIATRKPAPQDPQPTLADTK